MFGRDEFNQALQTSIPALRITSSKTDTQVQSQAMETLTPTDHGSTNDTLTKANYGQIESSNQRVGIYLWTITAFYVSLFLSFLLTIRFLPREKRVFHYIFIVSLLSGVVCQYTCAYVFAGTSTSHDTSLVLAEYPFREL